MLRLSSVVLVLSAVIFAQAPQSAPAPSDAIKAARKLQSDGKFDEAIAAYQKIVSSKAPDSWEAHLGIGTALDLKGDYAGAREHIQQAIDAAPADSKPQAWRAMAMSYGFSRDAKDVEKYGKQVFDYRISKNDLTAAAEAANEMARVMLESGDIDGAEKWYRTGHETALKKADLPAKDRDLWDFRWEHAQARLAARRGDKAAAQQHVTAAKAILDKGTNPEQAPFFPYLTGYVAYYAGDYKTAIADFSRANQNDPFNVVMLAQAYEKTGDKAKANEYYQKTLQSTAHNPTNAYARPVAQEKLAKK
jgi:tetratricopeptide (TPR) repeat protein